MTRIFIHPPTETELARRRQGGQFARLTINEVAEIVGRNRTREGYLGGPNECIQIAEWGIVELTSTR